MLKKMAFLLFISLLFTAALPVVAEILRVHENLKPWVDDKGNNVGNFVPDFYMYATDRHWTCMYKEYQDGNEYVGEFYDCEMIMQIRVPSA